jgi:hypothetical protein
MALLRMKYDDLATELHSLALDETSSEDALRKISSMANQQFHIIIYESLAAFVRDGPFSKLKMAHLGTSYDHDTISN